MSSPTPSPVAERLERLAEHAPTQLADADGLWSQGRRRQRARGAGTAACLVLVAVLGGVAGPAALQRPADLVAVSPDSGLRLPDVIREPGEWEPSFPEVPGRLVAAGTGTRGGWWSSRPALWGVSAATGESRFLDIPDAAAWSSPALSPDGRRLAYWLTDEDVEPLSATSEETAVTGLAVLDLTTGGSMRWEVDAPHGLMTHGLAWAGDVVWWSGGPLEPTDQEDVTRARVRAHTWDPITDERRELDRGTLGWDFSLHAAGPAPGGFLVHESGGLHLVRGERAGQGIPLDMTIRTQEHSAAALSPDGARVAAIHDPDPESYSWGPDPLLVGDLEKGATSLDPVGDVESTSVLGWRSPDEVVVGTYVGDGADRVYGASTVDIETAVVTPLVAFRGNVPSFAADAWSAEVIEAPDAPWRPDPRVVGALVLILGAFVVSRANLVRRRRAGA